MRRTIGICVSLLAATGCGDSCPIDRSYDPFIDPTDYVATIDNRLFPMPPGTRYTFTGAESVVIDVTRDTKVILGVTCTVVHEIVSENGVMVEDTYDWFAQDLNGTVWYFGEDTKAYEDGEVDTAGSWEAGVDGAKPGIVMSGALAIGLRYRQEYLPCEAEDEAEVVAMGEAVTVAAGAYTGCLKTRDFTRLEPDVNEYKYYCPGAGLVLEEDVASGQRVIELASITTF